MKIENPYASPTTDPVLIRTEPGRIELATLSERFAGALVDGLLNLAVAAMVYGILFALGVFRTFEQFENLGEATHIVAGVGGFVAFMLVQWQFLSSTGQTIGKRVMKTKMVTLAGDKPSMTNLVGKRYASVTLISLVPLIGVFIVFADILLIFRKDRRCLHDLIAGTQVVKALPHQAAT